MSAFKNKHLIIATLLAPLLALISYFGINAILNEKPHAAEAGQSYQLLEKPNCRRGGGQCGLKNGDFELNLSAAWPERNQLLLTLKSEHPLHGVLMELVDIDAGKNQPVNMNSMDADGFSWSLDMAGPDPENHRIHLVASSGETLYFGDIALKFINVEAASR